MTIKVLNFYGIIAKNFLIQDYNHLANLNKYLTYIDSIFLDYFKPIKTDGKLLDINFDLETLFPKLSGLLDKLYDHFEIDNNEELLIITQNIICDLATIADAECWLRKDKLTTEIFPTKEVSTSITYQQGSNSLQENILWRDPQSNLTIKTY